MLTFDFNQVREYADGVNAVLNRCDNGEGMYCETIDRMLDTYADCCCKFISEVRHWAREVFAGRVAFDQAAEQLWKAELIQLFKRATAVSELGGAAEEPCYDLNALKKLRAVLWSMDRMIARWVSPKPAVAPSARKGFPVDLLDQARERIAALPPLPAGALPRNGERRSS